MIEGSCHCGSVQWRLRGMPESAPIADLPIDHFDGLDRWEDLPGDGRCIRDLWF
jgi:hypothetical protein